MSEGRDYPWPVRRPPAPGWRQAAAVAVLSFDFDAESPLLAAGERYAEDLSAMSHQAYGPRVAVPRILELLAALEVRATFFVPGLTAERWPAAVRSLADAGHEVALHGYSHRSLVGMSEAEQRQDLERGLEALAALGIEPAGYRAPFWRLTHATLELLGEHGFAYDSSLMDDDRPYLIEAAGRTLTELPVHWSLDDWEQYAFLPEPDFGQAIEPPAKVLELWTGELDAMRESGSLCLITCHPFLSGRPSRLRVVREFTEFARGRGDVELLTAGEVARRAGADG